MLKKYIISILVFMSSALCASDWPIYKGNIYFTGNNDEIIVPNGNLKWLYQAGDRVYNPVVSEGKIYFIDHSAHLYCLNEISGRFIWKISIRDISAQFKRLSRAAGKIKYPLIKGDYLYLTDPVAIYCLNKHTGKVLWARTGQELGAASTRISGIYSDPIITDNEIYYGTRKTFMSRNLSNGEKNWSNNEIKSFSGFPTFYDDFIFVQSMDYTTGKYHIIMIESGTGKEIWKKQLPKPFKIFPPVVYKDKVYIPVSQSLYCLDRSSGSTVWKKSYNGIISSTPSFTDRSLIFTEDNRRLLVIDPDNGSIQKKIEVKEKSSPYYVTVRNQMYIAYNDSGNADRAYGHVKAVNFNDESELWTFKTPFPGGVSQPVASNGILFLPAGNYLYAVGARSYPRNVRGGSSVDDDEVTPGDTEQNNRAEPEEAPGLRDYKIKVTDENGEDIPAYASVEQRDSDGNLVYSDENRVRNGEIAVPQGDGVHVVISSDGYVPEGFSPGNTESGREVSLDKIETGRTYVVDDITFETDSAYLKKESLPILKQVLQILDKNPGISLEISGHTDNRGENNYNLHLSERRADAVAEYMIKNGISPERVQSTGYGETKPVADNNTDAGRQKNRRTEFIFKR